MRSLWPASKTPRPEPPPPGGADQRGLFDSKPMPTGEPLRVPVDLLDEDPENPRTECPQAELEELALDIAERGILQPIVADPADAAGRYRVRFGAKRLRAARQAGLLEVPVTVSTQAHDAYAQVAENLKRHGLRPLDLARFIRSRVDAGESNATVAKRLAVDQTTIAHHLTLLALPPVLDAAMREGRCTSPRTLHELSKVHDEHPEQVGALLTGGGPITRDAVAALRTSQPSTSAFGAAATPPARHADTDTAALICHRAHGLCNKLDLAITRLVQPGPALASPDELASLRQRLAELAHRLGN
jgi:ParB family chromosome partitioning protein